MNTALDINLIPKIDPEKLESRKKIFYWLSKTGRLVIIITEALVLTVFLSRFYYDSKIEDIEESIQNKVQIIEERKATANNFVELYKKTDYLKQVQKNVSKYSASIQNIILLIPPNIELSKISVFNNEALLSAQTLKIDYFALMIENFNKNNKVTEVILKNVYYNSNKNNYSFELGISFKPQ